MIKYWIEFCKVFKTAKVSEKFNILDFNLLFEFLTHSHDILLVVINVEYWVFFVLVFHVR